MTLKNILIVNDFAFINGGISKDCIYTANGLSQKGYNVIFFTGVGPVSQDLIQSENLKVVSTGQEDILNDPKRLRASLQGIWNFKAYRLMRDTLKGLDPAETIVSVHGWSKCLTASVVRAVLDANFPLSMSLHDYFFACPNGGFFNYVDKAICAKRAMGVSCLLTNCDARRYSHKLWRFLRGWVQIHFGRVPGGIKNIITLSDLSYSIAGPYFSRTAHFRQLYNPIIVSKFGRVRAENNQTYAAVGRISPEKGFDLFAEAVQNSKFTAVIIGDGNDRAALAQKYPSVKITGWQPVDKVIEGYRSARALIFPSRWYEVHPLVVREAASLGIPAVVPDTCSARQYVVDGETGLWFKGGDVKDLKRKIALLDDSDYVKKLSENAYNSYWASPPTLEKFLDDLVIIFQITIDNPA